MENIRILYVDDEEINLRIFKNTFRRQYNITLAESAKKGLKLLEGQEVDLIITDQMMPEMTGIEFLAEVQKRFLFHSPKRMMISGYAPPAEIEKAYAEYSLYTFISKPWIEKDLVNKISEALEL